MTTPHFDAAAVRQARPAIPLDEIKSRRNWPLALIALAVLAGVAGGVIGGVLSTGYLSRDTAPETVSRQISTETAQATGDAPTATTTSAPPVAEPGSAEQASPSSLAEGPAAREAERLEATDRESNEPLLRRAEEDNLRAARPEEAQAALRAALDEWVAATNARDLGRQLSFYRPTMKAFYRRRNASLEEVRADRARVFERAASINVRADAPTIQLSEDGRAATMRFRKRYAISGGGEDRSGEVLQELRWQMVGGRWRIVSERDLRVVR
jgi:ketosteroid isomerase-like protein